MQEILGFNMELRGMVSQPPFLIRTIRVRPSKTHRAATNIIIIYYLVDEAGRTTREERTANGERRTANANPPSYQLCLFIYIVDIETTYSGF